ncbi:MAG: hypothetical protein E6I45_05370 [Chloroflexi bacterium]|nr:MAG: hypothetical protein E6I45_05370 [Chloroflexota bacterium]
MGWVGVDVGCGVRTGVAVGRGVRSGVGLGREGRAGTTDAGGRGVLGGLVSVEAGGAEGSRDAAGEPWGLAIGTSLADGSGLGDGAVLPPVGEAPLPVDEPGVGLAG